MTDALKLVVEAGLLTIGLGLAEPTLWGSNCHWHVHLGRHRPPFLRALKMTPERP
jgi:hypothetical protein